MGSSIVICRETEATHLAPNSLIDQASRDVDHQPQYSIADAGRCARTEGPAAGDRWWFSSPANITGSGFARRDCHGRYHQLQHGFHHLVVFDRSKQHQPCK